MLSMNPTPVAPLTGLVDVMYGFGHDGWNVHGFAAGPAISGSPPVTSLPAVICIVFNPHPNPTECVNVSSWFDGSHDGVSRTSGLIDQLTLAGFIGSLNWAVMVAVVATFVCRWDGLVDTR